MRQDVNRHFSKECASGKYEIMVSFSSKLIPPTYMVALAAESKFL